MARWIFEPGHTEAAFRARHMMVTWVRGLFKDIHGTIDFDRDDPLGATFEAHIDATGIWTGEEGRDAHLRSADFLDVDNHPHMIFRGRFAERTGDIAFRAAGDLTLRGVTKPVELEVSYLGMWDTPYWEGEENRGTMRRIGFEARTTINRHDWAVSWQDHLPGGGVVVSNHIRIAIDVEAILAEDMHNLGIDTTELERMPEEARAGSPDAA